MTTTLPPPPYDPRVVDHRPTRLAECGVGPDDVAVPYEPAAADGPAAPPRPRWVRPAIVALLAATAAAYLWNLTASGWANSFYAAAVQAGTKSWKAFFFGSIDSSNFITVDKSPASLWVMELSGRVFGFSSWSMLMPEVLEGVAAVGLVYLTVKRWFGAQAGLLAGLVLACTPVAALMFRFNNPDAAMVLLLTAAAYTLTRALERAGTRWMVATGALVGLAFLAKMLQAFTVLPAFAGVYLLAAPTRLRRRLGQLALGGLAVLVSAGWWVAVVALWPAADRPMIDGSPDNSILNLIFGYNGLERLSSGTGGANFSGPAGVFRLFDDVMGGQASWLLPAALVTVVAGVAIRWRAPRTDRTRAAVVLWGGWLLVTGAVFSLSTGVIHTYYTVALAPAIAALVGIGAALWWRHRDRVVAGLVAGATVAATTVWAFLLLDRTPSYVPWLRWTVLVAGIAATVALLAAPVLPRARGRLVAVAGGLALVAGVSGPLAFTATTLRSAHTGSIPSAGPASAASFGSGGPGGATGPGGSGGPRAGGTGGFPGGAPTGGTGGFPGGGSAPSGDATLPTAGTAGRPTGGSLPGGGQPTGSARARTGAAVGGFAGGAGGGGGGVTTSTALTAALRSHASSYRWAAATFGSQSAASLELASGEAVMAIGGFNGQGGNLSLATFESYVAKGEVHWFIASGGGAGGPGGNSTGDAAITSWVESHFHATTIGGQTVYDLTDPV